MVYCNTLTLSGIVSSCEPIGVGGDEDIGIDDPMAVEDDAVVNREFETCLTAGNVDKKTHGLVILWHMPNILKLQLMTCIIQHFNVYSMNVYLSLFLTQSSLRVVYGRKRRRLNSSQKRVSGILV